jgi:hypothetical protein
VGPAVVEIVSRALRAPQSDTAWQSLARSMANAERLGFWNQQDGEMRVA